MTAYHLLSLISSSRFAFPCLTPVLPRRSRKLDFESTAVLKYKRRGDIEQRRTRRKQEFTGGEGQEQERRYRPFRFGGRLESLSHGGEINFILFDGRRVTDDK